MKNKERKKREYQESRVPRETKQRIGERKREETTEEENKKKEREKKKRKEKKRKEKERKKKKKEIEFARLPTKKRK